VMGYVEGVPITKHHPTIRIVAHRWGDERVSGGS
jgi:hypothetical protein